MTFKCPLSGQDLCHPCPVHRCPGNLSKADPERSCAYVLPDTSYDTLASIYKVEPSELKRVSQQQVSDLGDLLRDVKLLLDAPIASPCPNCGYVSPCSSTSICQDRKEAVQTVLVNETGTALKPAHIWYAVLNDLDSFLSEEQRDRLLDLVSQQHTRRKHAPTSTATDALRLAQSHGL